MSKGSDRDGEADRDGVWEADRDGVCGFFVSKKATNSVPIGFPVPAGSLMKTNQGQKFYSFFCSWFSAVSKHIREKYKFHIGLE